jgi:rhodanese-related sulfurtransferase
MSLRVVDLATAQGVHMANVRVAGPRIEAAEAKAMVDAGEAIVLDVVASHVWPAMARTIQDSIRIPPEEIRERFGELPRAKTIIAYCT